MTHHVTMEVNRDLHPQEKITAKTDMAIVDNKHFAQIDISSLLSQDTKTLL